MKAQIKKVAIMPNVNKIESICYVEKIANFLWQNDVEVMIEKRFNEFLNNQKFVFVDKEETLVENSDIVIAIGGDGTIIRASKIAAVCGKAVLGMNLGRLGFISGLEKENIFNLKSLLDGNFKVEARAMLSATVRWENKEEAYLCLNDAVISKAGLPKISDITVLTNSDETFKFRADGIILSTATGSTAYSFSAGGPIVAPNVKCVILTPICSHSLVARPIVFSDTTKLNVLTKNFDKDMSLTVDGDKTINLTGTDSICIETSNLEARLINLEEKSFYDKIIEKLK